MIPSDDHFGTGPTLNRRHFFSLGFSAWLTAYLGTTGDLSVLAGGNPVAEQIKANQRLAARDVDADALNPDVLNQLKKDAQLAWGYFSNWDVLDKPIVPVTAYMSEGKRAGYPILTMWDVGSVILACSSAQSLGLISQDDLKKVGQQLVQSLSGAVVKFRGTSIPNIEISTDNSATRIGFDADDTGRLLIALKVLNAATKGSLPIERLVGGWDFRSVIVDGRVCSVSGQELQPYDPNSYVHYSNLGYRLWGYQLSDPYEKDFPTFTEASKSNFLAAAASFGRFATEPLTTELIELGECSQSRFLATMLYFAQRERFVATGMATCVSEGSIDRFPWFTYQAAQFNPGHEPDWVVDIAGRTGEPPSANEDLRAVNTKGCYLWLAAQPGRYSGMLVNYARMKAADDQLGFLANIYETTKTATNCSDINTNALILESCAFILSGRRPLVALS